MLTLQIALVTKPDGSIDSATMTGEFQRRLAALQVAFTGEAPKIKATLSKREQQAVALGEALCPTKRRGGRKPDPNSKFQRISACMRKILANGAMTKDKLLAAVAKETGISLATCANNAMAVKGIVRNYGEWSLSAST